MARQFLSPEDRAEQLQAEADQATQQRLFHVMSSLSRSYGSLEYAAKEAARLFPHPRAASPTLADCLAYGRRLGRTPVRNQRQRELICFVGEKYLAFMLQDGEVIAD
jgi:hypothetical protein